LGLFIKSFPVPIPPLAGPENFQCRAVFIQLPKSCSFVNPQANVQPVFDSRHGRITLKSIAGSLIKGEPPAPISSQGF
jgi:hypothetical protein